VDFEVHTKLGHRGENKLNRRTCGVDEEQGEQGRKVHKRDSEHQHVDFDDEHDEPSGAGMIDLCLNVFANNQRLID
jgi:hypothetical protein